MLVLESDHLFSRELLEKLLASVLVLESDHLFSLESDHLFSRELLGMSLASEFLGLSLVLESEDRSVIWKGNNCAIYESDGTEQKKRKISFLLCLPKNQRHCSERVYSPE